jgi:hypothetical protein
MWWILLLGSALAAPPGFNVSKRDVEGCTLYLGPAEADGVVPMRAECRWPDVSVEQFDRAYADWTRHDEIFSSIASSDLVSTNGATKTLRQTYTASGISDREMLIDGTRTEIDGGLRFEWHKHPGDQGITSGNVEALRSDGFWEVTAHPEGGVTAIHQLSYDPGGRVPGFLVRWFQTSGLAAIVGDLKAAIR